MNIITIYLIAFFTGIFASMGLGGGMILIIYLTVFTQTSQLMAQGINLIFFIPIAILSLIIHTKNKLIAWKKIVPAILCGTISAILGSLLATKLGSDTLRKLFAIFILITGIKEIFAKTD